jgi:hypothetical protein
MISLAQGSAGLAMAFGIALVGAQQMPTALILLIAQSLAVACAALAEDHVGIAILAAVVNGGGAAWLLRRQVPRFEAATVPELTSLPALAAAVVLATLCQSRGALAQPLAVMLLAVLFAVTRRHKLLPVTTLLALQNGLALAAATAGAPLLATAPGLLLAIPSALLWLHQPAWRRPEWVRRAAAWGPLAVSVLLLAASLVFPLDPIGRTFAPLIAAWGVATAWTERARPLQPSRSVAAVVTRIGLVVAVASTAPVVSVLGLALAAAATRLPTARRRPDGLLLGMCGTGLALFGLLTARGGQPAVSFAMLFLGLGATTAVAADIGAISGILLLRLSLQGPWPTEAATALTVIAALGLAACTLALLAAPRPARVSLLRLGQLALVAAALSLNDDAGRLAAVFLLILGTLTDIAMRLATRDRGLEAIVSAAGLAGIPPLGIFPAVAMLIVAVAGRAPWLLLPTGACLAAMAGAGLPPRLHGTAARLTVPSLAWAPLGLALAFGYAAPAGLIRWLTAMTMATP